MNRLDRALQSAELYLRRYVVFANDAQPVAVVLWAAHTHCISQLDVSPYLAITSPDKRSGKTRLLEALGNLVVRPWPVITPSEAVVFRKVDDDCPSLLLDEADAIFGPRANKSYEGLRALLNAGNRRGTTVPRVVMEGQRARLVAFKVFCPKVLAGIGNLPDTVADRAIPIRMQRRRRDVEPIERLRFEEARARAEPIRTALAAALATDVRGARPAIPQVLWDRAQDNWEPLLAIADVAGGSWPTRARDAAVRLSAESEVDEETLSVQLLEDIRSVFTRRAVQRLFTSDLIAALKQEEERPWVDLYGGRGLGPHSLGRLLSPYRIGPRQIRIGTATKKGYEGEAFLDAWSRWLPPVEIRPETETSKHRPLPAPDVSTSIAIDRFDVSKKWASADGATLGEPSLSDDAAFASLMRSGIPVDEEEDPLSETDREPVAVGSLLFQQRRSRQKVPRA